ncbi:MAG: hypothetical protein AAB610_02395 [Patescibacteria group bacterium]
MKTIKQFALLALFTLGLQISVLKAADLTSEQTDDAFAKAPVTMWSVYYRFTGDGTNEVLEEFILEPHNGRWAITQLRINGQEIIIDAGHPLAVLPSYAGTVKDAWLRAEGYGADGQQKRYGYFGADVLKITDDIKIMINLSYVYAKIPYALTGGHTANNTQIQSEDGNYSGWYDSGLGVFIIGFDPLRPPTGFNLIDTRNNTIFGWLPFSGTTPGTNPPQNDGIGISLELPNRTFETVMTEKDWMVTFSPLKLDQVIPRFNHDKNAKTVLLHVSKSEDYVQVFGYGLAGGSWIEVHGLGTDGVMTQLIMKKVPSTPPDSIRVENLTGYQTYKVIVIGAASSPVSGIALNLYRSDYPWIFQDGPKGIIPETSETFDGSDDAATP